LHEHAGCASRGVHQPEIGIQRIGHRPGQRHGIALHGKVEIGRWRSQQRIPNRAADQQNGQVALPRDALHRLHEWMCGNI